MFDLDDDTSHTITLDQYYVVFDAMNRLSPRHVEAFNAVWCPIAQSHADRRVGRWLKVFLDQKILQQSFDTKCFEKYLSRHKMAFNQIIFFLIGQNEEVENAFETLKMWWMVMR